MTSITTLYICFLPLLLRVLLSFVIPTSLASAAAATTTTVDNNDIRPSRPPAPLFQGKGINHITLFLSLDPYDAKNEKLFLNDDDDDNNNNNTDDVVVRVGPRYELQMENRTKVENTITTATTSTNGNNDNDKYHVENGLWTNCQTGDIIPTSKKSRLFPMTITVHNIIKSSNKEYRFRVRAINRNGPSPWSSPSEIMETELSTPKAPIELKVESKTSNSIQLSWKQNEDEPMSNTFDLQYRLQMIDEGGLGLGLGAHTNDIIDSDQSALSWRNYPDPLLAISNPSMPEVQEITTLVDEGSAITSGKFWLRLRVAFDDPTQRSNVLESSTISKPIAFNATIESFQDAVEGIRGVRNVRVFRYRPGFWGTSDLPYRGTFSWRVEFDVIGQSSPLFEVHKDDLDGDYAGGYVRCQVRRLLRGQPPVYKERMVANINQLGSEKYYEIRVRGVNSYGKGDWGAVLSDIKTDSDLPDEPPVKPSENQLNSNHVKLVAGSGQRAGNDIDPDYIAGAAMGGFDGENGANGIVVIIQYGREKLNIPSRLFYYYIGRSEQYIVPNDYDQKQIEFIDLKLWGGGGAGGGTNRKYTDHYQDGYSYGGGGGFVQTRLKLDPGDVLTIKVGSGGIYHRLDGEDTYPVNDGFFGGGQGGQSLMGRDGGSGGGYSEVMLNGHTVAMAGGGGGGGATDYCCAHGGPGGGRSGGNGTSPNTPWSLGEDDGAKGIIRNEFTAQDCMSSYCIDDRDKTGLPAFHLHLDRGFAPSASYDIKSKGGIGGKQDLLGTSGSSSDYYVNDYYISPTALVGTSGFGGRGADGKEGGGGGGAGFIGGGGGGSGVDGSGGGGGSGYVDFSYVLVSKRGSGSVPNPPETPTISLISHNSFEINWQSGLDSDYSSIGKRIRAFDIEMSRGRQGAALEGGRCSDEFELVDRVLIQGIEIVMNTTIKELHPLTAYCVRLIAIGDKGTSERSQQIEIITIESPKNKWLDIYPREDIDALNNRPDIEERSRLKNDHNRIMCEIPSRPAPRRGHTLSFTNGKIYLFGGITDHCICLSDTECEKKKTIYSNEVWSFDLRTKIWKSLSSVSWTNNSIPTGREKHSATVLQNGKILIIGGKTDTSPYRGVSNTPLFLGDVWEMDPGQSSSHTVKGLSEMQMITEGGVSYHSTDVSIKRKSRNREGMLCVKEVSVEVMIDHPCVEQIGYITLQRSKMTSGLMSRSSTTEAKLFIGTSPSDTVTTCTSAVVNITFYDNAEESILSHGSLIPSEGRFGAAENLRSHFEGTPVDGEWVLSIFDTKIDNIRGSLLDWKLHFDLDYCTEGLRWSKLSTNSNSCEETTITDGKILNNNCNDCGKHIIPKEVFTPRYSHTAVAVGNDVFVIGGYAHGVMSEIWRFNYDTRDWVQLHDNLKRSKSYGQAATLTPFGMIAIGGIRNTLVGTSFIDKVFVYDVLNENETTIDIDFDTLSQSFKPENRYQSSLSYIGQDHFLFNEIANVDKKSQVDQAILMFGGDMDLLHSSYLEDMWTLTLKKLKTLKDDIVNHQERYEVCRDLLSPDKRVLNPWDWSCGYLANVNSTKICRWEDVVRQAWCLGQYQSFISPL